MLIDLGHPAGGHLGVAGDELGRLMLGGPELLELSPRAAVNSADRSRCGDALARPHLTGTGPIEEHGHLGDRAGGGRTRARSPRTDPGASPRSGQRPGPVDVGGDLVHGSRLDGQGVGGGLMAQFGQPPARHGQLVRCPSPGCSGGDGCLDLVESSVEVGQPG